MVKNLSIDINRKRKNNQIVPIHGKEELIEEVNEIQAEELVLRMDMSREIVEIADILMIKESSVRSKLHRAKKDSLTHGDFE